MVRRVVPPGRGGGGLDRTRGLILVTMNSRLSWIGSPLCTGKAASHEKTEMTGRRITPSAQSHTPTRESGALAGATRRCAGSDPGGLAARRREGCPVGGCEDHTKERQGEVQAFFRGHP